MPRYDPDVIAALAEGRLDPEEAAALERDITTDPAAAAQLAAHRVALKASATATRPELSDTERSDLHAAVADALGITAPASVAPRRARRIAWGPVGIAAAALVGLVAVVPVVGLLSTGGAGGTADLELAAEAPTTLFTAEAETRAAAVSDEAETLVGDAEVDDALTTDGGGFDATAFGSSTTSPAAEASSAAAPATTSAEGASSESTTTTSQAASASDGEVDRLAAELEVIRSDPAAVTALAGAALEDHLCFAEDSGIRSEPPPARYVFEYDNGEVTVIVYFELDEGEAGPFHVWGVPDCANLVIVP